MAATVQLVNDKGEKVWRYTVDAKELLAGPNPDGWRMTGDIRRSGWATPSGPRARISTQAPDKETKLAETVATATAKALVDAGVVQKPVQPPVTDAELDAQAQPTGEEPAGLNEPEFD